MKNPVVLLFMISGIKDLIMAMKDGIFNEKEVWERINKNYFDMWELRSGYIFRKDLKQSLLDYLTEWVKEKTEESNGNDF